MTRAALATIVATVVWSGLYPGAMVGTAQTPPAKPAQEAPAAPTAPRKFVTPVKGTVSLGYLKPAIKVEKEELITIIQVKNLAQGPIAGLRVDEYWYDKGGTLVTGSTARLRQPLMAGDVYTVELRTPRKPNMDRNSYQFTHANGKVEPKLMKRFDEKP
jgi:hypothetical protein